VIDEIGALKVALADERAARKRALASGAEAMVAHLKLETSNNQAVGRLNSAGAREMQ